MSRLSRRAATRSRSSVVAAALLSMIFAGCGDAKQTVSCKDRYCTVTVEQSTVLDRATALNIALKTLKDNGEATGVEVITASGDRKLESTTCPRTAITPAGTPPAVGHGCAYYDFRNLK